MNVIGVELHLPKRSALPGLAVFLAIGIVAAFAMRTLGLFQPVTIAAGVVGMLIGTLTFACGCSIDKYGIRGALLTTGFALAMLAIFAVLHQLNELI